MRISEFVQKVAYYAWLYRWQWATITLLGVSAFCWTTHLLNCR